MNLLNFKKRNFKSRQDLLIEINKKLLILSKNSLDKYIKKYKKHF